MFSSNTSQTSGGYEIQRSLRFNKDDSAYLNRTPASASNRTTWTWSAWVKRTNLGDFQYSLFGAGSGSNYDEFRFTTADKFRFFIVSGGSVVLDLLTTQVFRDPSAWYHFVVAYDSTQATASNRCKLYVNGVQITALDTATYPAQNTSTTIDNNVEHDIGLSPSGFRLNAYMTEVNFIDGQALTPSSFGAFDAQTGVWGPTAYAGSYGTNGFYLNFSDNSNTTAATLGKDYSGNGNNWTPNNFSVSAGAGNDSLTDTPTNNFSTLNPLQISTTYATISNGNLQYVDTTGGGSYRAAYSTVFASSGKYYFEATVSSVSGAPFPTIGIASPPPQNDIYIEQTITGYQGYCYVASGDKATDDTYTAFGASYTAGDTVGVAVDVDAGKVWFAKNGTWQASGDPAAGTSPAFNIVTGRAYGFAAGNGSSASSIQIDANFGQRPFAYTTPSGFKALNTQNLPTPTIGATTATQAGKFFNPVLWTGNGSNPRAITGVGFQPDFSWLSRRDIGYGFWLYDAVRGATKAISSQSTAVESTYQQVNSFDVDGFTQAGFADQGNNVSGGQYVAWNWKANGAGVTNTAGSITSTVSANTTSGFSVVTYTGTGAAGPSVGHGLSAVPKMIILKQRTAQTNYNWFVYHQALGNTQYLLLNSTNPASSGVSAWNNTTPTSSVFTIGSYDEVNRSGSTFVAYCFAEVPGYSKFGSYTGNASTDGPFCFCGFRPAYVMYKKAGGPDGDWVVLDVKRDPTNVTARYLAPNASQAESNDPPFIDILSNGFKIRRNSGGSNENGVQYIFAAFAESPFKYALAR